MNVYLSDECLFIFGKIFDSEFHISRLFNMSMPGVLHKGKIRNPSLIIVTGAMHYGVNWNGVSPYTRGGNPYANMMPLSSSATLRLRFVCHHSSVGSGVSVHRPRTQ